MVTLTKSTFIENLARELANHAWSEITPNFEAEGTKFDLYAKKQSMHFWQLFVATSPQFIDQLAFEEYANLHEALRKKAKSWIWQNFTILCVIAETGVSPDITGKVDKYSIGFFQRMVGGCLLCIVDLPKRESHMKVPGIPVPVHTITREFKDIVDRTLSSS